jgi:tRNA modification GTPase
MINAEDSVEAINRKIKDVQTEINDSGKKLIIVLNKLDKIDYDITRFDSLNKSDTIPVFISAKHHYNIDNLINTLLDAINYSSLNKSDIIVTNTRHYEALTKSYNGIFRVLEGLKNNISGDFLAQDIRDVLHYLGEITGEITTDEILGNIFAKFCIGK